ncbi:MAG TPA: insulinase family protein [Patescibacteria group bacterium]|nr:insulinase family protein [Patescibacteria group bacterium]
MKHSVEEVVLQNGSRGLLIHIPNATVMSYDFEFRAGDEYTQGDDIYETAHIMEHMVLGANEQYDNARIFNAELEKNGAYSNASTGKVSLKYVADCADFEWDRIFGLLRLAITKPLFLESEFKAESGNVKEELTGLLNNNWMVLWQRLGQASGERFLNDEQRLKNMPNVQLEHIKEHYHRTHTSDNMRFVIAGSLKDGRRETVIQQLEKWQLPRGERFSMRHEELVGAPEPIRVVRKDVENMIFGLAIEANWRFHDNERDAMRVLSHMLTGTLHSHILGQAREQGLIYGMGSHFEVSDSTSEWDFEGQVSLKNAPKLFDIIVQEVSKVMKGDIKQKDIEAAKQFALGKHQMGCQTVGSIANWYSGRYFFDGYINDYDKRPLAIEAVNKDIIVQSLNNLMSGKRWAFGGLGQCTKAELDGFHEQLSKLFI